MILITNKSNYVEVNMLAFKDHPKVRYSIVYLMKDKTISVNLEKDSRWVEIITCDGVYQLDQTGVHGFPAEVGSTIPLDNTQLAYELAKLKNL